MNTQPLNELARLERNAPGRMQHREPPASPAAAQSPPDRFTNDPAAMRRLEQTIRRGVTRGVLWAAVWVLIAIVALQFFFFVLFLGTAAAAG